MKLAYLLLQYPSLSQAFILREVEHLRRLGIDVRTLSVRTASPEHVRAEADRRESRDTLSALPVVPWRMLAAHVAALRRGPTAYARVAYSALAGNGPGLRGPLRGLAYFAIAVLFWRECRSQAIRHVHTHFSGTPTHVTSLVARLGNALEPDAGWSWSITVHGPVEFFDVEAYRLPERLAEATFVACISDFARSQVLAFLPHDQWGKVHVVHCGVDPSEFSPAPPAEDERVQLLCVARLVPFKGYPVLLRAVAGLLARGVPVHLTVVGDGPMLAELEELSTALGVSDHVTFAGGVGQDDIRQYYRATDIFCLSSFAEGVPVALMEAMAMQKPVIATRIAGIPELVEDRRNGLIVAPGNVEAVAQAVEELAGDQELRRALGRCGRATVETSFDVRQSAEQLAVIFRAL